MISKFFFCGGCCCFCFFFGAPCCCCCLFFIELCCFSSSLVPLLSQHTLATSVSAFLRGVFFSRWNPDSGVVVPSAAAAVNYRAEETAVVPRAG